ncbi:MAG: hypothetical protein HQL66_11655 [Magnetococcales bacterium]|nr:hypothetical protein [Magnetococcales bacterium]
MTHPHPFGGLNLADFAQQKGTPFLLCDGPALLAHLRAVRETLGAGVTLSAAAGITPNPHLLQWQRPELDGFVVTSGMELRLLLGVGVHPGMVDFVGPGKRNDELELAIGSGVAAVSAESEEEFERIDRTGARIGRKARVVLRLSQLPTTAPGTESSSGFGFSLPEAAEWLMHRGQGAGYRVIGLAVDLDRDSESLSRVLDGIGELVTTTGHRPERLLLLQRAVAPTAGGSSGVAARITDVLAWYREVGARWRGFVAGRDLMLIVVFVPSSVVGDRVWLHVARVVVTRRRGDCVHCLLDASLPVDLSADAVVNLSRPEGDARVLVDLAGPGGGDCRESGRRFELSVPRVGDVIGFFPGHGRMVVSRSLFMRLVAAEYLVTGPGQVKTVRHIVDLSRLGVPP